MTRGFTPHGTRYTAVSSRTSALEIALVGRARLITWLLVLIACGALLSAAWATPASATLTRSYVASFGAFVSVESIATDSAGNVYVYDGGAGTIYKFDAAGNPVNFSATGTNAISNVGFSSYGEGEIAVDSSSGPAKGDIYVAHAGSTINIYNAAGTEIGELTEDGHPWGEACGVAVDTSGNVYVGLYGDTVNKYTPVANPVANSDYVSTMAGVEGVCNVAVDSVGDVFSDEWGGGPVTRYEASQFGALSAVGWIVDSKGSTLTVDASNDRVYVDENNQIAGYGPKGQPFEKPTEVFAGSGEGAITESEGIAVNHSTDNVYVGDGGVVNIFGPTVALPTVSTGPASDLAPEAATVSGEVNPEGVPVEQCYFEYGATTAYGHTIPCTEKPSEIGGGEQNVDVHADLVGLTPDAVYHYRLVAGNSHGFSRGADERVGLAPPGTGEEYATDVTDSSVNLNASINPESNSTEYYFEYGPTTSYGERTSKVEVKGGESFLPAQAHVQGLAAQTTYHYRFVARSVAGTTDGSDLTFTTQGSGGPINLLDGRQWELVSPPAKYGAGILPQHREGSVIQAAEDGDAITYVANNPIEPHPEGNRSLELSQIIARRGTAGGWSNRTINTPNEEVHGLLLGLGNEYKRFSPDLSSSIVEPGPLTPLAPSASERTSYVRDEVACLEKTIGCYTPILTPEDTMPGAKWDTEHENVLSAAQFVDATSDLKHVVIRSRVPLLEGAGQGDLYEWSEGHLQLVSVDEAGNPVAGYLGNEGESNERATISSDGSRIVWCEPHPPFPCVYPGAHLYMRDTQREETIQLDPAETRSPEYQVATEDDSRVFFTAVPEGAYDRQLYECEVTEAAGKLSCASTEVAPEEIGLVLGINGDGTIAYFVSRAALSPGAHAGEDNLYVSHLEDGKWNAHFIAKLSSQDGRDWAENSGLAHMTARVSPNGRYLAFMSNVSLTGYDNRDAVSNEPDEEVFIYDDQSEKLVCASCNRSGARPHGMLYGADQLVNSSSVWSNVWVAGSVPGWTNVDLSRAFQQPRYLSDEGRLFFNSSDGLVPQDSNGLEDVYEYEPYGAGSCAQAEGCVNLISSGSSSEESVFLDASVTGDDVFFLTNAKLTSQDDDTAMDVYDAHVCTEAVPCTSSPVLPPPCNSGDSCKPAPTPQPAIFGEPASATFSGAGNLASPAASPAKKAKAKTVKRSKHKVGKRARKKTKHKAHGSKRARAHVRAAHTHKPGHNGEGR